MPRLGVLDKHLPTVPGDKSELMRPRPELSLGVHWASHGQSSSPSPTPTRWKMQWRLENDCYFSRELLLSGLSHCCHCPHHLPDCGTSSSHPFSASLPQNLIQSGPFRGQPTSVQADALSPAAPKQSLNRNRNPSVARHREPPGSSVGSPL